MPSPWGSHFPCGQAAACHAFRRGILRYYGGENGKATRMEDNGCGDGASGMWMTGKAAARYDGQVPPWRGVCAR